VIELEDVRKAVALSVIASVLALGGCVVGPQYVRPEVGVNDHWTTPADPAVVRSESVSEAAWWKAFHAPLDQLI
jgi:outer membrane protein TolC